MKLKSQSIVAHLRNAALVTACASVSTMAGAATLLSEDFSGATLGLSKTGILAGTQFAVSGGNIDIIGPGLFSCVQHPAGKCLDLVGSPGAGAISSIPAFNLTSGTYHLSFDAMLQGYEASSPATTTFRVSLGSQSFVRTATGAGASYGIDFSFSGAETGAHLGFATLTMPDSFHGAVLDNIVLTTAPVPEPETYAMLLAGLGLLGAVARRRKQHA